jgi:D-beta-D-heptose 7-phosphate kinase/D-beta-D-heptose 1-phosphate adenosyltransferase
VILTFDELGMYRGKVAMVDGGFDPLHAGHVDYFREAAALGLPLLCCVAGDAYVSRKHKVLLPEEARAAVLDAIRYISYVHVNRTTTAAVLSRLVPALYVKGKDWEGRLPPEEVEVCAREGVKIVFLDTVRDSSTRILERYLSP